MSESPEVFKQKLTKKKCVGAITMKHSIILETIKKKLYNFLNEIFITFLYFQILFQFPTIIIINIWNNLLVEKET